MKLMTRTAKMKSEGRFVHERTAREVPMTRRWLIAAGMLLALTLTGAAATAVAAGLTIAVSRTPLSLPLYVAESQGYFAAEGVQVTFNEVVGGHRSFQKLLDGEADLATSSDAVIMSNSFKRNDFAVVATFVTAKKDINIVAGKDAAIARPQQIAGKRVGTVLGSASHYYLDTWLVFHGVDPKAVQLVSLQPEAMAAALAQGQVDAVAIWEPFGFEIIKAIPGAKLLPNPDTYVVSFNLIVPKRHLGQRDDDLVKVLRALLRAEQFIQSEPAKAQGILLTRLKLDQDFIDWIWQHYKYRLSLEKSLITTLESEARWARQEGYVTAGRSPNYLEFIYTEPLRKARPDRLSIGR